MNQLEYIVILVYSTTHQHQSTCHTLPPRSSHVDPLTYLRVHFLWTIYYAANPNTYLSHPHDSNLSPLGNTIPVCGTFFSLRVSWPPFCVVT